MQTPPNKFWDEEIAEVEATVRAKEMLKAIVAPSGEWCALCEERMAVQTTADGVPACAECIRHMIGTLQYRENRAGRRRIAKAQSRKPGNLRKKKKRR